MTLVEPLPDGESGVVDDYRNADRGLGPACGPEPGGPVLDEMIDLAGQVRPGWAGLAAGLELLGPERLQLRRQQVSSLLEDDGVTYGGSPDADQPAGTWRLDPLPVILGGAEWATLSRGLEQRAELLDRLQADLYGPRDLLRRGLIPPELILGHAGFLRQCDGIRLPGPRQLLMASTDLVRLPEGWRALGDRAQAPSGAGYAMENRRIISRVLPGLYRDTPLERLRPFFHALRAALQEVAPSTAEVPSVVILTPGAASETSFDQAFLSTLLGFPVVEGQDLTVREGRVWLRSLGRPVPVDVVLRRVDGWFCDPLQLRPDSRLGVPGLLQAARLGNVSIVNPPGAGVLENPGLVPFLPALCSALLDEPLRLESVRTWWCGDPSARSHVLANLRSLVLRPIARGVGRSNQFGWELSTAEAAQFAARIEAEPHAWCAQQPLQMSTAPVVTEAGLEPRRMVLRSFAVAAGGEFRLLPGGLARVAGQAGSLDVASQAGALAKDVWVTSRGALGAEREAVAGTGEAAIQLKAAAKQVFTETGQVAVSIRSTPLGLSSRVAEDMFWLGRYAERAEDGARVLRVATDLVNDHGLRSGSVGAQGLAVMLRAVTAVTGAYPGFEAVESIAHPQRELIRLAVDPSVAGTLAHAVRHALLCAQAVREQLSTDTWLVIGGLDRALLELNWTPEPEQHLQRTLSRVLEGLLAFSGLAVESMVRDSGWYVMDAGRRIERALQLVALLRATLTERRAAAVDELVLESVLIAAESVITYRRRSSGRVRSADVLALLLFDPDNPRGVMHQLEQLSTDLHRLPGSTERDDDPAVRLRRLQAWLREADLSQSLAGSQQGSGSAARPELADFLNLLGTELAAVATAVESTHFARSTAPQPMSAELS